MVGREKMVSLKEGRAEVELDLSFLLPLLTSNDQQPYTRFSISPSLLSRPMSLKILPRSLSLSRPNALSLPPRRPFFSSLPSLPSLLSHLPGATSSNAGRTTSGGGSDGDEHHYVEEKILP